MKFGSNIHRADSERKYYYDGCKSKGYHQWQQISNRGNEIEVQCGNCGVLGHAIIKLIK